MTERATEPRAIDRFEGGIGWLAHPEEIMERAGHALATTAGVYLIDPVDAGGLDDLVAELGEVAGVVQLSNHHTRNGPAIAKRHGVPILAPRGMTLDDVGDTPVERIEGHLPGTAYRVLPVAVGTTWQEFALDDGETLVVSESVGTAAYFRVGDERLGVILLRRLTPPRDALGGLEPDRILVGHGTGVFRDAPAALADALAGARRRFPRALIENGPSQVRTVTAALRT